MNGSADRTLLVIAAKEPVPGRVKTRFAPELTPEEAAGLYRCMIADRIEEFSRLDNTDLAIAFSPAGAGEAFASFAKNGFRLFAQRGEDLGERMHTIFVDTLASGYQAVTIIDSDSPDLPKTVAREAFRLLLSQRADAIFGPCRDGGYYLIGLRRPHPELFADIPWSTAAVLEATLARAREIGLKTELLSWWNDLDTYADLIDFYNRYRDKREGNELRGEKTLSFLATYFRKNHGHAPVIPVSGCK